MLPAAAPERAARPRAVDGAGGAAAAASAQVASAAAKCAPCVSFISSSIERARDDMRVIAIGVALLNIPFPRKASRNAIFIFGCPELHVP
jgi:hypothetical protein